MEGGITVKIQILGAGCAKCVATEKVVKETIKELGINVELSKITRMLDIIAFGVMATPAIVVDGEVKIQGKVPSRDEVERLLQSDL